MLPSVIYVYFTTKLFCLKIGQNKISWRKLSILSMTPKIQGKTKTKIVDTLCREIIFISFFHALVDSQKVFMNSRCDFYEDAHELYDITLCTPKHPKCFAVPTSL